MVRYWCSSVDAARIMLMVADVFAVFTAPINVLAS
jgi:hypothetical protein